MHTLFSRPDRVRDPLYVCTVVYNAHRFRTRWKLHEDFAAYVERLHGILYTVEIAFGERDHVVTRPDCPHHLQLRTSAPFWLKENALNLLFWHLPRTARYIAYVDADMTFARPDIFDETVHTLQHYQAVQMFSEYQDIGPDHQRLGGGRSYMAGYLDPCSSKDRHSASGQPAWLGAPGGAWAFRRSALEATGGLLDVCIVGSGDTFMAQGMTSGIIPLKRSFHPRYLEHLARWEGRAQRGLRQNIGMVNGLMLHGWHGSRKHRGYGSRDEILIRHQFNPDADLLRDMQGLYQLDPSRIGLRDDLIRYGGQRNEDSIEVD